MVGLLIPLESFNFSTASLFLRPRSYILHIFCTSFCSYTLLFEANYSSSEAFPTGTFSNSGTNKNIPNDHLWFSNHPFVITQVCTSSSHSYTVSASAGNTLLCSCECLLQPLHLLNQMGGMSLSHLLCTVLIHRHSECLYVGLSGIPLLEDFVQASGTVPRR